jgi:hypothetical protein
MRKVMAAAAAVLLLSAGALVVTGPAAADEVWVQGFQRSGPAAVCTAPADETPWQDSFGGQREWTPSWAQWANSGQGGWVCQREIRWARSASSPGICALVDKSDWALFGPDRIFPAGTDFFTDSSCTSQSPGSASVLPFVYAATRGEADVLCNSLGGLSVDDLPWGDPNVWSCGA